MTLDDLERKIGIFMNFSGNFGLRPQNHSQGGATVLALVAWRRW